MWFNTFSEALGWGKPGAVASADGEITENGRPVADKGRDYVFTKELAAAVDAAIGLGRPLLVAGDPGCGKTELGYAVARRLGIGRVHFFSTKSTSEARDLFYTYDAIGRFREAQAKRDPDAPAAEAADYIEFQALGRAILDAHAPGEIAQLLRGRRAYAHPGEPQRSVVIIDEVDKASRDFPNDLLREIEDLAFRVPEMQRGPGDKDDPATPGGIPPRRRPIVIVTSNEERALPDAFLRRCVFHEIAFPADDVLRRIVASGLAKRFTPSGGALTLPKADGDVLLKLLADFRGQPLDKRPGVSEAIDAATLMAYPAAPEDPPPPSLGERLRGTQVALAKLKNDRTVLNGLIGKYAPVPPPAPDAG